MCDTSSPDLNLMEKYLCVMMVDGSSVNGECFTIDPVTGSYVLISEEEKNVFVVKIIHKHAIKSVCQENPPEGLDKERFLCYKQGLMSKLYGKTDNINGQVLSKRKEILLEWLKKNQLPVSVTDSDSLSVVNGIATIEPPYTVDCCRSSNTIVLDKIMKMIKSCPELENL